MSDPAPMTQSGDPIEELVRMGVLGRWWCERCEDWVPYKKVALDPTRHVAMTEAESRQLHGERHDG